MPNLTQRDGIYLLAMGDDENRFSPTWLAEVEAALDAVEANPAPLVAFGDGKFFSNGLDLEWLSGHPDELVSYAARVEVLFARILALPVHTVAAINGHAFGAGAMLAIAFDWRVMRGDRGFFCFPEVDINIPFTPGMSALIQAKLSGRTAIDSMTTGRRFGGDAALAAGIVDVTASEGELLDAALVILKPLIGKSPVALGKIKRTMYTDVVRALTESNA